MSNINNSILFTSLATGTTIMGVVRVDNLPLIQRYKSGTGQFVPNFEAIAENERPVVYPYLSDTRNGSVLIPSIVTFKYNSIVLTFDANGLCTNSGMTGAFKKITHAATISGRTYNIPAIRVMKNLVPYSSYDNDLITISGSVERQGRQLNFADLNKEVIIEESTGSQHDCIVTNNKGSQLLTANDSVVETATLYKDGVAVSDYSSYTFRWVKVLPSGDVIMSGSERTKTIVPSDVDSKLKLRCDIMSGGEVIASGFDEITDFSDPFDLLLPITGHPGTQFDEDGQSATVTPKVVERSSQAAQSGWAFTFYTKNNAGADFVLTGKSAASFAGTSAQITKEDVDRALQGLYLQCQASKS